MYELDDVLLSVRRYYSLALPGDWRIRLERIQVADDERPAAVLEAGVKTTPVRRASIDQGPVTERVPVTLTAYPSLDGSVRAAGRRARQLATLLERVTSYGLDLGLFPAPDPRFGRPLAGPDHIPLWDYADVAVEGDAGDRTGPTLPHDWVLVEDSSAQPVQDLEDERRWTVICELQLAWDSPGRIPQDFLDEPIATGPIHGSYGGEVRPSP